MIRLLLALCACAAQPPRAVVARSTLPENIRVQLPTHGIVVWIAGEQGSLFVTLDRDTKMIRTRTVRPASDETQARTLRAEDTKRLWSLADAAWRTSRGPSHPPHLDYNEVLAVGDGDDAFYLDGHGSIEAPAAAAAVRAMLDVSK